MKRSSVLILLLLVQVVIPIAAFGACGGGESQGTYAMKLLPKVCDTYLYSDIQELRGDSDLKQIYESYRDNYAQQLDELNVSIHQLDWVAVGMEEDEFVAIYGGDIDADEVKWGLQKDGYTKSTYREIELWSSEQDGEQGFFAFVESAVLVGTEQIVKQCIDVVAGQARSIYDDAEFRGLIDRLPAQRFSTSFLSDKAIRAATEDLVGPVAMGISVQKLDEENVKYTVEVKYEDESDAQDGLADIQNWVESWFEFEDVRVDQKGVFVHFSGTTPMSNVLEQFGRGGADAFETDILTVQLASATFFADIHSGWKDIDGDDNPMDVLTFDDNVWGRTKGDTILGHYYPTAIGRVSNHTLSISTNMFDLDNQDNPLILGPRGLPASDVEIQAHAIWMGLLVHDEATYTALAGTTDRWQVSPLGGENALYLNQMPSSAITYNGDTYTGRSGSYCWVVGKNGVVYGIYKATDGYWYSGFNGAYP